jgi:thiamine monophosphate kinase
MMADLRPILRASIDTSDGVAACLHIVARLNKLGLDMHWEDSLIHPQASGFCQKNQIHPLMLWMSDLGDLQSLLFIKAGALSLAQKTAPDLVVIGRCTNKEKQYTVRYQGKTLPLPLAQVTDCARDAKAIRQLFYSLNQSFLMARHRGEPQ